MSHFTQARRCGIVAWTAFGIAATGSLFAAPEVFVVDPARSTVAFEIRHLVSTVTGTFSRFAGEFTFDRERPEHGAATFTIEVASLATDDARRTARLARDDFFATAQFPAMRFTSTIWKVANATAYEVSGHLTIKGVPKPVVVQVKPPGASGRWEATATIDRRDFGVMGGPPGLIGNEVVVRISLEAQQGRAALPTRPAMTTTLASADEPGERLTLRGTVYAADGTTPSPGAKLYLFHTDTVGKYSPVESGVGDERNPRLQCRLETDHLGRFEVRTIMPGPYPGGKTPRHIHIIVTVPGRPEHNATFSFAEDPNLTTADYQKHGRDGTFSSIRPLGRDPDGTFNCVRDIRLSSIR